MSYVPTGPGVSLLAPEIGWIDSSLGEQVGEGCGARHPDEPGCCCAEGGVPREGDVVVGSCGPVEVPRHGAKGRGEGDGERRGDGDGQELDSAKELRWHTSGKLECVEFATVERPVRRCDDDRAEAQYESRDSARYDEGEHHRGEFVASAPDLEASGGVGAHQFRDELGSLSVNLM